MQRDFGHIIVGQGHAQGLGVRRQGVAIGCRGVEGHLAVHFVRIVILGEDGEGHRQLARLEGDTVAAQIFRAGQIAAQLRQGRLDRQGGLGRREEAGGKDDAAALHQAGGADQGEAGHQQRPLVLVADDGLGAGRAEEHPVRRVREGQDEGFRRLGLAIIHQQHRHCVGIGLGGEGQHARQGCKVLARRGGAGIAGVGQRQGDRWRLGRPHHKGQLARRRRLGEQAQHQLVVAFNDPGSVAALFNERASGQVGQLQQDGFVMLQQAVVKHGHRQGGDGRIGQIRQGEGQGASGGGVVHARLGSAVAGFIVHRHRAARPRQLLTPEGHLEGQRLAGAFPHPAACHCQHQAAFSISIVVVRNGGDAQVVVHVQGGVGRGQQLQGEGFIAFHQNIVQQRHRHLLAGLPWLEGQGAMPALLQGQGAAANLDGHRLPCRPLVVQPGLGVSGCRQQAVAQQLAVGNAVGHRDRAGEARLQGHCKDHLRGRFGSAGAVHAEARVEVVIHYVAFEHSGLRLGTKPPLRVVGADGGGCHSEALVAFYQVILYGGDLYGVGSLPWREGQVAEGEVVVGRQGGGVLQRLQLAGR